MGSACRAGARGVGLDFGRYHALVIGINEYKNLPKLETAVNDATAVADALRQRYGFEVTLLLNPGRSEVIRAMDKLRGELTERDNLLIYMIEGLVFGDKRSRLSRLSPSRRLRFGASR